MHAGRRVWSVRGAVSLERADKDELIQKVGELLASMMNENEMLPGEIVNIQFTQTSDINFYNAASAARQGSMGNIASSIPLFCAQEPEYPGSLPLTIRVLISYYHSVEHKPEAKYLYGARVLREDLLDGE